MGSKRSFKFYRKNEQEVMDSLGLKPTKNSGSGWIEKEDGQNDYVVCQLKSTDAQSIKINQKDIRTLEKNSDIEHKLPMFAIQFLNTGEVWLMCKPEDICEISKYIQTGICEVKEQILDVERTEVKIKSKIKSSESSRNAFHEELKKEYEKFRSSI